MKPDGNWVPMGFGAVRIRDSFFIPFGKGSYRRAIKIDEDFAIVEGSQSCFTHPLKIDQVVFAERN